MSHAEGQHGRIHFHPKTVSSTDTFVQKLFHPKFFHPKSARNKRVRTQKDGDQKGWGPKPEKVAPRRVRAPNMAPRRVGLEGSAFFFPLPPHVSFFLPLSGGLLVEMWPRVAAVDNPNCAFGLPGVIGGPQDTDPESTSRVQWFRRARQRQSGMSPSDEASAPCGW